MRGHLAILMFLMTLQAGARAANITSSAEVDSGAGQPFSYQITADNAPTSFTESGLGSISGLSLDKNSGLISGTPESTGTFNITVTAKSKTSTATKKIVFVISKATVNFTSAISTSGALSASFSFQLAAPVTSPTFSASGLPAGLKISASSGLITGTPTAAGVYAVSVSASNKTTIASGFLTISINGGVSAPSSISLTPSSGTVGAAYTGGLGAKGAPPIAFTILSGVPPGIVTTNANIISGTPTTVGVFPLVVMASNAFGSSTMTINFTITAASGSPLISSPLAVSGEVGESLSYTPKAAGKTPITFSLDATKLPRGLAQDSSGVISGVPFDPGTFMTPFSASNSVGADNETLTFTIASLAPSNTGATVKFTDGYRDASVRGDVVPNSNFNFTAVVNTPGIDANSFSSGLSVDVTIGIYEFSRQLGDASGTVGGRFIPGKSALFNFTTTDRGHTVRLGSISFMLAKDSQIKITARRRGSAALGGVQTLRSEQLAGTNQNVSETIPVKIQIGTTLLAAFYMPCQGTAAVKTAPNRIGGGTLSLSTVKLKGSGSGAPSP